MKRIILALCTLMLVGGGSGWAQQMGSDFIIPPASDAAPSAEASTESLDAPQVHLELATPPGQMEAPGAGSPSSKALGGRPAAMHDPLLGPPPNAPLNSLPETALGAGSLELGLIYPGFTSATALSPLWFSLNVTDAEFQELSDLHFAAASRLQQLLPRHWAKTRALLKVLAAFPLDVELAKSVWQSVQEDREAIFNHQLELGHQVQEVLGESRWVTLRERWRRIALAASAAPDSGQWVRQPRRHTSGPGHPEAGPSRIQRATGPGRPPGGGPPAGDLPGAMPGFEFPANWNPSPPPPVQLQ